MQLTQWYMTINATIEARWLCNVQDNNAMFIFDLLFDKKLSITYNSNHNNYILKEKFAILTYFYNFLLILLSAFHLVTQVDKYRSVFVSYRMLRKIEWCLCRLVSLNGKHSLSIFILYSYRISFSAENEKVKEKCKL